MVLRFELLALFCLALQGCSFPNYRWLDDETPTVGGATLAGTSGEAGTGNAGGGGGGGRPPSGDAGAAGSDGAPLPPCNSNMLVCATMDTDPVLEGWMATALAGGELGLEEDAFSGDWVMQFRTLGAEGGDFPIAALSVEPGSSGTFGRLTFELRLEDTGPYTNVALTKLDFGERELGFYLLTLPDRNDIVLRYARQEPHDVVWQLIVAAPDVFQQTRRVELVYRLDPGQRRVSVFIEDEPILIDERLDEDWSPASPSLKVGMIHEDLPSSGATVELDDVGFDDQPL